MIRRAAAALVWWLVLAPAHAGDAARARMNFIHHCTGCHLTDGSGAPDKGILSMRGTLSGFLQVPGGREFIAQVPGVMNSPLNDRDIADLMNWLVPYVSPASTPAEMTPYTREEIARLRRTRPLDMHATRQQLMDALRDAGQR